MAHIQQELPSFVFVFRVYVGLCQDMHATKMFTATCSSLRSSGVGPRGTCVSSMHSIIRNSHQPVPHEDALPTSPLCRASSRSHIDVISADGTSEALLTSPVCITRKPRQPVALFQSIFGVDGVRLAEKPCQHPHIAAMRHLLHTARAPINP